jgi:protein-S-isoprenylcysteine O-methyltransferase Ste14
MDAKSRVALLVVFWIAWWIPFFVFHPKERERAVRKDRSARWGVVLGAVAFATMYTRSPVQWTMATAWWRIALGSLFEICALLLSWTAIRHLGRQWRIDAGLNANHELIRTGPYTIVRHPIYASMFCMLLMSAAIVGRLPGWPIAIVLFIVGIEIRIRAEDGLLRERFGEVFERWARRVPAYVPFVR